MRPQKAQVKDKGLGAECWDMRLNVLTFLNLNLKISGPRRARSVVPLRSILIGLPLHLEPHENTDRSHPVF